ncbi:hypothetical protein [Actinorugispora endophytica]|uniref:Anti-sigma regulatory factor (Ser/Thr protein kinase) n=1 Tax=Actinorugispora endophytica TaxID=1605990 RepID=A0A4R6V091_9ACTN|nr:hypothetical protein [Actinorugispora endophytica]TDQ53354.1 hypothetical protein EV190_104143 [Actinorugispora endophytica]
MDRVITVGATGAAPQAVRAVVRRVLTGHRRHDEALLVASELAASAVRAAGGEITVRIVGPEPIRIEVTDQRGGCPRPFNTRIERDAVDPLGLVSLLASVGSHRYANGDCVTWAVLGPAVPVPTRLSLSRPCLKDTSCCVCSCP